MDKTGLEERLKKVSQEATRGNVASIEELMKIATELYKEKNFNLAAETFKDAAICYRIEAFRQRTKAEGSKRKNDSEERPTTLLSDWIKDSKEFKTSVPAWDGREISASEIYEVLVNDIFLDPEHKEISSKVRAGVDHVRARTQRREAALRIWLALIRPERSYADTMSEDVEFAIAFRKIMALVIGKLSDQDTDSSN